MIMVTPWFGTSIWVVAVIFWACHMRVDVSGNPYGLQQGFYDYSCPQVESVVTRVLKKFMASDPTLGGPLLRVSYHDCFVRGCDASILLNSINGVAPEKEGRPNLFIRGYEVYDGIKAALEQECPGTVSCADIIQLVARDVTALDGGPWWHVALGRRDGSISVLTEAEANLLPPSSNYTTQKNNFAAKGLSEKHLVLLTGAHTIGRSRCSTIESRLYNFSGTGRTDPTLDRSFARELKKTCPVGSTNTLPMDGTELKFDTRYFQRLQVHKGLFESDNAMISEPYPASVVDFETHKKNFFTDFPVAMVNMAGIEVLTGTDGQIRTHCAFVN